METPPKWRDFATFTPEAPAAAPVLDRALLRGVPPEAAAERMVAFYASRVPVRATTRAQRKVDLAVLLRAFAARGLDMATLSAGDAVTLREYLRESVARGAMAESYAAHLVSAWNPTMRVCFGEKGKAGEGLLMKGFQQRPKLVQRWDAEEMLSLVSAARRRRFKTDHHREAFVTYLEVAVCAGPRIGSLVCEACQVGGVDWEQGVLRLVRLKNKPEHEVVLSERALVRLRTWTEYLRNSPLWRGPETPLFSGPDGTPLSTGFFNEALKSCAALAGIAKPVTTHVLRKSVGTHIGRDNPKLAMQQLGITAKIFERHYNQPSIEDRLARRDLLPGAAWKPRTPEEVVATAHADYLAGRISRADYELAAEHARSIRDMPGPKVPETSAYA